MTRIPESPTTEGAQAAPSVFELFDAFSRIGLAGFGGVLPWVRRMLVEQKRWLSAEEFNTLLGLCQFLPGPNVINLSVIVGRRFQGAAGALAASTGLMAAPMVIIIGLAMLYDRYGSLPLAQGMLRGIAAVGAGLIFATGIRMGMSIKAKAIFLPFAVLVFIAIALLHWPMPLVMVLLAAASSWLAWLRARKAP